MQIIVKINVCRNVCREAWFFRESRPTKQDEKLSRQTETETLAIAPRSKCQKKLKRHNIRIRLEDEQNSQKKKVKQRHISCLKIQREQQPKKNQSCYLCIISLCFCIGLFFERQQLGARAVILLQRAVLGPLPGAAKVCLFMRADRQTWRPGAIADPKLAGQMSPPIVGWPHAGKSNTMTQARRGGELAVRGSHDCRTHQKKKKRKGASQGKV